MAAVLTAGLPAVIQARAAEVAHQHLGGDKAAMIASAASSAACRFGVPIALILAIIETESSYRSDAKSTVGCFGLMQVCPSTGVEMARTLGKRYYSLKNTHDNVLLGVAYLKFLADRWGGHWDEALTAYNVGPWTYAKKPRINAYARQVMLRYRAIETLLHWSLDASHL